MMGSAYRVLAGGLWVVFAAAPAAEAQAGRMVTGRVLASDGTQLEGATVAAVGGAASTTSGASGAFRLALPPGATRLVAVRIGFAADTVSVDGDAGEATFRLRPAPLALHPLTITADRGFSPSSSALIGELDLHLRPRESSQELLRVVPGVFIAQHAGGGKAEQIFARGFDADHGTDVAISVDGLPVNMVSHAHGQGYADLHFLIPETVERVEVRKGPYDPRDGDFATAAAISFRTRDRLAAREVAVRGGSFETGHFVALVPLGGDRTRPGGYLAAAGQTSRGPFQRPQDYRRTNAMARWTAPAGAGAELFASASTFSARWDASGQVPERAVRSGAISRFGAIDGSEGGRTGRHDAVLGLRSAPGAERPWEVRAYATRYDLDLFSNFTFFLADPERGDGIEQVDRRWVTGLSGQHSRPGTLFGVPGTLSVGSTVRADRAEVALHSQRERERLGPRVQADVRQTHVGVWAGEALSLSGRVRLQVGLRADVFRFGVVDRLAAPAAGAGAVAWKAIVSPRATLAGDLARSTTVHAAVGTGFHSNDARHVATAAPGTPVLPRAVGADLGVRHTWTAGSVAATAWALSLESELVYVGDEGTTEASGRSRRRGVDLEGRVRVLPWVWADADVSLAQGRFPDEPDGADRIPLAPTVVSSGGLTVRDAGPWTGGLRFRQVGSRPANETGSVTARGYRVWQLFAARTFRQVTLRAGIENLFDAEWNEAQFATTSRLAGEPAEGITELHFTPGAPRSGQVGLEYRF
ncbi:MAG: TonB-dependent receptor [Gemmatimonadetes bacterium]|nr:TonB-dependent receptor [Gemmatimonadota bacterium]